MTSRFLLPTAARVVGGTFLALAIIGVQVSDARTGTTGNILVVDDDGEAAPGDCDATTTAHPTIIAAVAAADPGDTILVCQGVYPGNVVIAERLTLKGAKAGTPGPGRDFSTFGDESVVLGSITVQAANVVIDGFWVTKFFTDVLQSVGILVKTAGCDALLTNNVVDAIGVLTLDAPVVGIYLENGPDRVKVVKNKISNIVSARSAQGILIGDSTASDPSRDILLSGNLIELIESAARGAYGIQVNNAAFTTVAIRDNAIRDLTGGGWAHAIGLEGPTPNVEVVRNNISNVVDLTPTLQALQLVQDAVAVFFEANPYFPTAEVHFNNFDVTAAAFGIALHPDLLASAGYGKVDGTCNWWDDPNGPGPVGPGAGAKVTPKVVFDPFLDAPAPGGNCRDEEDKCDKEDNDDHDHDGKRDDTDDDDDNDGKKDYDDDDDDNDGKRDYDDDDDDNDGIGDEFDDKSTRQVQRSSSGRLSAGAYAESILASDGGALPMVALIESPNAQFLKVEVFDPLGRLVGVSLPLPGRALVTAPALLPGIYTVRVRNIGVAPIDYTTNLITTMPWF